MHHHHHHASSIISTLCNSCTIAGPLPPVTAHKMASGDTQTETRSTHSLGRIKSPDKDEANNKVRCSTHPLTHTNHFWGSQLGAFSSTCEKRGAHAISIVTSTCFKVHLINTPHTSTLPSTQNPASNKATCSPEVNDRQTEQQHKTPLTPKTQTPTLLNLLSSIPSTIATNSGSPSNSHHPHELHLPSLTSQQETSKHHHQYIHTPHATTTSAGK